MRSTKLPSWISRPLGLGALPVPASVFEVAPTCLRHASFRRVDDVLECDAYHEVELDPENFVAGGLGGSWRERDPVVAALDEILAHLDGAPAAASLLLPESWLRVLMLEGEAIPAREREEMLRWRLKKLVPFRVEDLRVAGVDIASLPGQQQVRTVVGFVAESVAAELEEIFSSRGVEIGQVSNRSLSLGVYLARQPGLKVAIVGGSSSYTLVVIGEDELLLARHKEVPDAEESQAAEQVRRELRLTSNFLREHLPSAQVSDALVCAPPAVARKWRPWLEEAFAVRSRLLDDEGAPDLQTTVAAPFSVLLPLGGAAWREIR